MNLWVKPNRNLFIESIVCSWECVALVLTGMFVFMSRQRALLVERFVALITNELTFSLRNLLLDVGAFGRCRWLNEWLFRWNIPIECVFGKLKLIFPWTRLLLMLRRLLLVVLLVLLLGHRTDTVRNEAVSRHFGCNQEAIHWYKSQCWHIWIVWEWFTT